jgi:hypothetical protein
MFREYSTWRTKLEQIEGKMRGDVEFWKQTAEKAQRDIRAIVEGGLPKRGSRWRKRSRRSRPRIS